MDGDDDMGGLPLSVDLRRRSVVISALAERWLPALGEFDAIAMRGG
jgi:hypothetical protein